VAAYCFVTRRGSLGRAKEPAVLFSLIHFRSFSHSVMLFPKVRDPRGSGAGTLNK
jgi:hypothetical protein